MNKILHVGFMFPLTNKPHHGSVVKDLVQLFGEIHPNAEQFFAFTHYGNENISPDLIGIEKLIFKDFKISKWNKLFQFFKSSKLLEWAEQIRPDYIHFHNFFPGVPLLLDYSFEKNLPCGISFRGSCLMALKHFRDKKGLENFISNSKFIHFNSHFFGLKIIDLLSKNGIYVDKNKIKYIPNFVNNVWIDTPIKQQQVFNKEKSKEVLIIAGSEKRKNLMNLFLAIKGVKQDSKYSNIIFKWIGPKYDPYYFTELSPFIEKGIILRDDRDYSNHELIPIIDESRLVISVALLETFGMVYAEAITRNIPVIYTKDSGFAGFLNANPGEVIENPVDRNEIELKIKNALSGKNVYHFEDKKQFQFENVLLTWKKILEN